MKNNIDYYQHFSDSHQHPKFKLLRSKYGWAGEGMFWALNNEIAKADNCELDISRKFVLAGLLEMFRMTKNEFNEFLDYLVNECELIIREGDKITTSVVKENLEKVIAKREKNKQDYAKRKSENEAENEVEKSEESDENYPQKSEDFGKNEIQTSENEIQTSERTQSKVKESKEKKRKEKESKEKEKKPRERAETSSTSFSKTSFPTSGSETSFLQDADVKRITDLFRKYTRIRNPDERRHIAPLMEILAQVPEKLTKNDVWKCISDAMSKLATGKGVKMDFLTINIRRCVARKHEATLEREKQAVLREAQEDRRKKVFELNKHPPEESAIREITALADALSARRL